ATKPLSNRGLRRGQSLRCDGKPRIAAERSLRPAAYRTAGTEPQCTAAQFGLARFAGRQQIPPLPKLQWQRRGDHAIVLAQAAPARQLGSAHPARLAVVRAPSYRATTWRPAPDHEALASSRASA